MGLFSFDEKRITRETFDKEVKRKLRAGGMSIDKIGQLNGFILGSLDEEGDDKGIDRKEADKQLAWMRENKGQHKFTDSDLDKIQEEMDKRL